MSRRVKFQSLPEVLGQNCKTLRDRIGCTQDDLARHARQVGLRWRASSVGDLEAGRSSPNFATVIAVAAALQSALDEKQPDATWSVGLDDLVRFDGVVTVNELLSIPGERLTSWSSGDEPLPVPRTTAAGNAEASITANLPISPRQATAAPNAKDRAVLEAVAGCLMRAGKPEARLAKRLDTDPRDLAAASWHLWKRTFTEERNRRAGPDSNAQKRGQVARTLEAEVRSAIAEGGNQLKNALNKGGGNGNG